MGADLWDGDQISANRLSSFKFHGSSGRNQPTRSRSSVETTSQPGQQLNARNADPDPHRRYDSSHLNSQLVNNSLSIIQATAKNSEPESYPPSRPNLKWGLLCPRVVTCKLRDGRRRVGSLDLRARGGRG